MTAYVQSPMSEVDARTQRGPVKETGKGGQEGTLVTGINESKQVIGKPSEKVIQGPHCPKSGLFQ